MLVPSSFTPQTLGLSAFENEENAKSLSHLFKVTQQVSGTWKWPPLLAHVIRYTSLWKGVWSFRCVPGCKMRKCHICSERRVFVESSCSGVGWRGVPSTDQSTEGTHSALRLCGRFVKGQTCLHEELRMRTGPGAALSGCGAGAQASTLSAVHGVHEEGRPTSPRPSSAFISERGHPRPSREGQVRDFWEAGAAR